MKNAPENRLDKTPTENRVDETPNENQGGYLVLIGGIEIKGKSFPAGSTLVQKDIADCNPDVLARLVRGGALAPV